MSCKRNSKNLLFIALLLLMVAAMFAFLGEECFAAGSIGKVTTVSAKSVSLL